MAILEVKINERLAEQDHSSRQAMVNLLIGVAHKIGDHTSTSGEITYDGRRVGSWRLAKS